MASIAYTSSRIFTGTQWLEQHAIVVQNEKVEDIVHLSGLNPGIEVRDFGTNTIIPAFADLQLYGAHEKLLAVYPTADTVQKTYEYSRAGGAAYCMPTVATNSNEVFLASIDAIKEYWKQGGKGVLGLHIEGPWIHPAKRGAHVERFIHPPTMKEVEDLLAYGKGVIKMITLAPEVCDKKIIQRLKKEGIIVAAGHSNATYEEATEAFENGVSCVTHLYNAMSPLQHRAPGLAGATMNHEVVHASIIPDGYHVDYPAIAIAKKVMGDRLYMITDAVTETTQGIYEHHLKGDRYEANGVLSGSALTMLKGFKNLVTNVHIEVDEAIRMCSLYPARVMQQTDRFGKIENGLEAKLLVINEALEFVEMID